MFVWLGDNVYADTQSRVIPTIWYPASPEVMAEKLLAQSEVPTYRAFKEWAKAAGRPIVGTWDDHDYGQNNGDRTYPHREVAQQLMLDFLEEPADSARRQRQGIYEAYTVGEAGKQVQMVLLDVR